MHAVREDVAPVGQDASVASLLTGIVIDIQALAQQETALATEQLREEVANVVSNALKAAAGGVLGALGLWLLAFGGALAIPSALGWPLWAGFTTVGVVALLAASIAFLTIARRRRKEKPEWNRQNGSATRSR
jgi:putative superfamily III holin-X